MQQKRRLVVSFVVLVLTALVAAACSGSGQEYPAKPIEIVVPFNAGGAVDTTIRIIAAEAEKNLGQKILIVNKGGGGAVEGQSYVARAKPDGYTLLAATSSLVSNTLTKEVDYTIDSFDPIIMYNNDPEVLVVYSGSPFESLQDVIEAGKSEPVSHATSGHSTSHHIAAMMLENATGMQFKYVHTKGGSEQTPMIAGGHVLTGLSAWGEVRPMVEQGNLRILGVMAAERDPRIPDVPTFKEQGVDLVYGAWRGIAAPKGTPKEIIDKLHDAFKQALESEDVKTKFAQAGFPHMIADAEEFGEYMKTDYEMLAEVLSQLSDESQ